MIVGLDTFYYGSKPHCPYGFIPQLKQAPRSVRTTVWAAPHATADILWFINVLCSYGV